MSATERKIKDPEFARRLNTACEMIPHSPPLSYGRLTWVKRLLEAEERTVSLETVRKWFSGESKPDKDNVKLLAKVLDVDEAWLSLGLAPELTPREQKLRNAMVDGVVNVVAGLIQMGGGHPAFPEPDDKRAEESHIDLYAIIRGARYEIHVMLAQEADDGQRFTVPATHEAVLQLGVVPGDDLNVRVVEVPEELIATGVRRGGAVEVTMDEAAIERYRIRTFSKRL